MPDNKNWLRNFVIGNKPSQPAQTWADLIGGAVLGTGFIGAYFSPMKTYAQATKGISSQVSAIAPAAEKRAEVIGKGLEADLSNYEAKQSSAAQAGLSARGITDPQVAKETASSVKSGLSGAYAQARSALARAKLNAQSSLASSMSSYHQSLAQKQFESVMQKYASQAGIWGALGGVGASLIKKEG